MKITDKYVFFWNGIYSQWYSCNFEVDGEEYTSAEQYMMHQKALLFNDYAIAQKILETNNPSEQKGLGRRISNFNKDIWDKNSLKIVIKGNLAKFSQNPYLLKQLLATENRIFCEASPYDYIWGVGLHEDDERILNPINWEGLNLLGQVLTIVRNELNERNKNNN